MSQSFQTALTHAGQRLSGAGIEEFRREARMLLALVVWLDPLQVSMRLEDGRNAEQSAKLETA